MRREVELGFHSEWGCLLFHVPTAGPSDSVILFHTAVERARCRLHKLLHTGGVPTSFTFIVRVVADCLFGLYGSEHRDELFIGTPHPCRRLAASQ